MIFLQLTGATGDTTVTAFKGQIELASFQFGATLNPAPLSKAGAAGASKPDASEVTVSLQNGPYSPSLLRLTLSGKPGSATISLTRLVGDTPTTYLKYVLKSALVTGWSQSSGGDRPSESLTLGYTALQMAQRVFDVKGLPTSTYTTVSWSEATRKVV
jgi:type VI secretion system secreted protein Hcp